MKKLVTLIAITGLAVGAYAQGLVSLTDTSIAISTNTISLGGTQGALLQPAGSYYFEMLFINNTGQSAPTFNGTSASLAAWTDSTLSGTNTGMGVPTAAYLGHITGQNSTTGEPITGWNGGTSAFYVVLGWSANEGTWAQVQAALNGGSWLTPGTSGGLFGYSMVGNVNASASPAPAVTLFGAAGNLINTGFQLTPIVVPEPSTLALMGLGSLSLLLFRRRNSK